jgi:hypothetical protein
MKTVSAVEWLAEKYNYITWMRNRDEMSAGTADKWRQDYLEQAKAMEKEQIIESYCNGYDNIGAKQYYNDSNPTLSTKH